MSSLKTVNVVDQTKSEIFLSNQSSTGARPDGFVTAEMSGRDVDEFVGFLLVLFLDDV